MNARHAPAYHTDACAKCGVTAKQLASGASPWCDYLDRAPDGRWAVLAHIIGIAMLVGAPLHALLGGGWWLAIIIAFISILIAQIHAGEWDWVSEAIDDQIALDSIRSWY